MGIFEIMRRFPDKESCLEFLESIRWKHDTYCPHCGSINVGRKNKNVKLSRWNCHDCRSSFSVTSGTMFHGTKIPLQKWFLAINMMMNARKGISSCQLSRELEIEQKAAWYLLTRIRKEMAKDSNTLLEGIVELDETFVGGKPRKHGRPKRKRGKGSPKIPVLGAIERGGKVFAKVMERITAFDIQEALKGVIDFSKSRIITDEYGGYSYLERDIIRHKERFGDGDIHTNTIESFWALIKRAWHGVYHHYRQKYMPLYIAEACYRYNHRNTKDKFMEFVHGCFS